MKRIARVAVAVALLVSIGSGAAVAQTEPAPTEPEGTEPAPVRTTSTTLPGATDIGSGYSFTSAVINTPDQPTRLFDALHAATFVQSFLAYLYFGTPEVETPPEGLPVSRV